MDRQWNDKIFNVVPAGFEELALEVFAFQYQNNTIYRAYCDLLGKTPQSVDRLVSIPFLPVGFFKSHRISSTALEPEVIFESSGTTGTVNSRHPVRDLGIYEESFIRGFESVYGPTGELVIIGLLPSYLERSNSSLVYMVDKLVQRSGKTDSGFYLHNTAALAATLRQMEAQKQPSVLVGVTFALLDFAGSYPMQLEHCTIMETGGMKGRRQEMIRAQVQDRLKQAFGLSSVHSEYGMTELLSQAYSTGGGLFRCPPWMKVLLREEEDPLSLQLPGPYEPAASAGVGEGKPVSGAVNIIDLANIYSCSFIATDDAAKLYPDGSFEILGRLDNSDLRGCSLLTL